MRLFTTYFFSMLGRCIEIVLVIVLGLSVIPGFVVFGAVAYPILSLLAVLASILIHEIGHIAAAIALGWKFRRIAVGPLQIELVPESWRIRLAVPDRDRSISVLGCVSAAPSSFTRFRLQCAIVTAGGPCLSLMATLAFVCLMFAFGGPSLRSPWAVMIQWSTIGLFSLFPHWVYGSDGETLWRLCRGGTAAAECQRANLCNVSSLGPLRPRDWPPDLMRSIGEPPGTPVWPFDCYLRYIYSLDIDDVEAAATWLKRLLDQHQATDPPEYLLEAAYFFAAHLHEPEAARDWIAKERRDVAPWVRDRAKAGIALATGLLEEARECNDRALADLRSAVPCGAHEYEIERLRAMGHRLDALDARR
jgi:hypothetical protein